MAKGQVVLEKGKVQMPFCLTMLEKRCLQMVQNATLQSGVKVEFSSCVENSYFFFFADIVVQTLAKELESLYQTGRWHCKVS